MDPLSSMHQDGNGKIVPLHAVTQWSSATTGVELGATGSYGLHFIWPKKVRRMEINNHSREELGFENVLGEGQFQRRETIGEHETLQ